jgi:hypothetical protein
MKSVVLTICLIGLFLAAGCTNVEAKRKARQDFDQNEIHVYFERLQKPEIEEWFHSYKTDPMPFWFIYGYEIQVGEIEVEL